MSRKCEPSSEPQSDTLVIIIPRDEIKGWEVYILAGIGGLVRPRVPVSSPDAPFPTPGSPFLTTRVHFLTMEAPC